MSDNIIYEIAQMMGERNTFQDDMQEATTMLGELFRKKYIDKINTAIKSNHVNAKRNPPREVQLLSALKAYAPEHAHSSYDRMIDAMLMANTFKNMNKQIADIKIQEANNSSVHSDGIYDVDDTCLAAKNANQLKMANMLVMMSMLTGGVRQMEINED